MDRRTRPQPLVALLTVLLPVMLVLGIYLGGHPDSLPTGLQKLLVSQPNSQVVNQAVDLVERDYYRPISASSLDNASLSGLVGSLGDEFSNYFTPAEYAAFNDPEHGRRFAGVGMDVEGDPRGLRVVNVFPGAPAQRAGLHGGDVIVAVDGRLLRGRDATAASNAIKGRPGTSVTLTWLDAGRRITRRVTRAEVAAPIVQSAIKHVDGHTLAWISLATFDDPNVHNEVRAAVNQALSQHAQGIVFDLRDNGGGLLNEAVLVASIFIPDGTIVSTDGRTRPRQVYSAVGDAIPTSIPMVVLVNRDTASASEIVTAALQDHHRATVVGTHTFGKGVFQEIQPLSNGGALDITVGEYFTPNGRNLGGGGVRRGAGVTPDVYAADNLNGTRDTALDVALRVLASKLR